MTSCSEQELETAEPVAFEVDSQPAIASLRKLLNGFCGGGSSDFASDLEPPIAEWTPPNNKEALDVKVEATQSKPVVEVAPTKSTRPETVSEADGTHHEMSNESVRTADSTISSTSAVEKVVSPPQEPEKSEGTEARKSQDSNQAETEESDETSAKAPATEEHKTRELVIEEPSLTATYEEDTKRLIRWTLTVCITAMVILASLLAMQELGGDDNVPQLFSPKGFEVMGLGIQNVIEREVQFVHHLNFKEIYENMFKAPEGSNNVVHDETLKNNVQAEAHVAMEGALGEGGTDEPEEEETTNLDELPTEGSEQSTEESILPDQAPDGLPDGVTGTMGEQEVVHVDATSQDMKDGGGMGEAEGESGVTIEADEVNHSNTNTLEYREPLPEDSSGEANLQKTESLDDGPSLEKSPHGGVPEDGHNSNSMQREAPLAFVHLNQNHVNEDGTIKQEL